MPEKEIQNWIKQICGRIKYFEEDKFDIHLEDDCVCLFLPGWDALPTFTIEEFNDFGWEMSGFKILEDGRIHTTTQSFQIIKAENEDLEYYLKNTTNFYQEINGIELRIIEAPIYVGIACLEKEAYHEEFKLKFDNYLTIEITYEDKRNRLSIDKETELIYSYLFEISNSTEFIFYLSDIIKRDRNLESKISKIIKRDPSIEIEENDEIKLKPLLNYSDGMKLYVSALQTNDAELRLLNFYKILEFFAPIVINMNSYDFLAKKLDSPKALNPDRDFLKSIFDLVNSTNQNLRDSELIKSVFNNCFDLIDTFEYLPKSIQSKVLGQIKAKKIDYDIKKDKLTQASNIIATILYSTRNKVVHAKSNFESSNEECQAEDLEQLNMFLKEICARTIRWYTKLPEIQRTK